MTCHCGKDESTETCCTPYLQGAQQPATAEELMRARYTAFVEADIDYIVKTHDPETVHSIDKDGTEQWAKDSKWLGLEILETEGGQVGDTTGSVKFCASYELNGTKVEHREDAKFRHDGKQWLFVDGQQIAGPPVKRETPKVGRNDPCPCGNGKKYKNCCGKAA